MTVQILSIIFTALIAENIVLVQFQGICPFLGVSKRSQTAVGMGLAVTCVMAITSVFTYAVYYYVLVPLGLEYLQVMAFILLIASIVQILEMALKKFSPTLYSSLGVYLPLITTNCAVLGTANKGIGLNGLTMANYTLLEGFILSIGVGLGFLLVLYILSAIREKGEKHDIPKCFKGFPVTLVAAAIMALAFSGLSGLFS